LVVEGDSLLICLFYVALVDSGLGVDEVGFAVLGYKQVLNAIDAGSEKPTSGVRIEATFLERIFVTVDGDDLHSDDVFTRGVGGGIAVVIIIIVVVSGVYRDALWQYGRRGGSGLRGRGAEAMALKVEVASGGGFRGLLVPVVSLGDSPGMVMKLFKALLSVRGGGEPMDMCTHKARSLLHLCVRTLLTR
jgi:hypothetical protein